MWKVVLCALCLVAVLQQSQADIPCPLKLIDGEVTHDGINLTFRNTGKLPIQELELSCRPLNGQKPRGSVCRTENGLFYPGQQYDLSFQYGTGRRVELSLKSARLSDGTVWSASRHQTCKPLKALPRKTP
jgi:hypothetical protein